MAVGDLCYTSDPGVNLLAYKAWGPSRGALIYKREAWYPWLRIGVDRVWNDADEATISAGGGVEFAGAAQTCIEQPAVGGTQQKVGWTYSDPQTAHWFIAPGTVPTTNPASYQQSPVSGGWDLSTSGGVAGQGYWQYNVARTPDFDPTAGVPWSEYVDIPWTGWSCYFRLFPGWAHYFGSQPYRYRVHVRAELPRLYNGTNGPAGGVVVSATLLGVRTSVVVVPASYPLQTQAEPATTADDYADVLVYADGSFSLSASRTYPYP